MSSDEYHRQVALLALLQFVLIVGGWIALATVMKFEGYPDDNPAVRFKPMPVALREHGTWALLVPVIYGIAACIGGESSEGKWEHGAQALSLVFWAVSVFLLLGFLASAASPYSRGLLIRYM